MKLHTLLLAAVLTPSSLGLKVPPNVQAFQDSLKKKGQCSNKLASGFSNSQFDKNDTSYCGDHLEDYGIVYLQGSNKKLADMDVDCDGAPGGPADDGRCDGSTTTIPATAVRSIIKDYDVGISDLSTFVHSFVVFGNSGTKPGWKTFDPREYGVEKTSLMAVVCGDQMFYAVWGDSNGDHGDIPSVGEASLSLATACYGNGMNGGSGSHSSHEDPDVLYIAFTGQDAVPGPDGANWAAKDFKSFHSSIVDLGDKLVKRIGSDS